MRLDKWIWSVRLVKNRTLSTFLIKQGKVRVNGVLFKPAKLIKREDIIEISGNRYRKVQVKALAQKPVKKETILDYYMDLSPQEEATPEAADSLTQNKFSDYKFPRKKDGQISKRDKRARAALKRF